MTERDGHPVELLPELALGVLDGPEAANVRAHLEGCEECRGEFAELERAARLLPFAAEERAPSPGLRDEVMQRISREPRPIEAARRQRRPWVVYGAAAAAGVGLLAAGLIVGAVLGGEDTSELEEQNAVQAQVVDAAAEGTLERSTMEAGGVTGSFVRAPGASTGFVILEGAPGLSEGKAYQAWYLKDANSTPQPSDTFADAEAGAWIPAPGRVDDFGAVAFTIEDAGGATTPSQKPFMVIPLASPAAMHIRSLLD